MTRHRLGGGRYEIRLRGHLDARWAAWFDGLALGHKDDGTTVLAGFIADQTALHGLLQKVRDVGLPLVSVGRVEPSEPDLTTLGPRPPSIRSRSKTGDHRDQ